MTMNALLPTDPETEEALNGFLEDLPQDLALHVRSLAHAWASGDGRLQVGRLAIRLLAGTEPTYTCCVIHAPRGDQPMPSLEFARVLMEKHGIDHDRWVHWSDEFADLAHRGLDPTAKFPTVRLGRDIQPGEIARLATGLRDLAKMAGDQ